MSINRKLSQKCRNVHKTEHYAVMKKTVLLTSAELSKCCCGKQLFLCFLKKSLVSMAGCIIPFLFIEPVSPSLAHCPFPYSGLHLHTPKILHAPHYHQAPPTLCPVRPPKMTLLRHSSGPAVPHRRTSASPRGLPGQRQPCQCHLLLPLFRYQRALPNGSGVCRGHTHLHLLKSYPAFEGPESAPSFR